jgi:hypothetical protein
MVSASNSAPAVNANDNFTITVTSDTGSTVPSGSVSVSVDGGTATSYQLTANGTYLYTTSFSTAGTHQVVAEYSGDATHANSTGSASVNVAGTSSGTGSFKLAGTSVTVSQGNSGPSNITVTPASGYTGTVDLSFTTSNDSALQNLCYSFTNQLNNGSGTVTVSNASAVTTQLLFDTNASDCVSAAVSKPAAHAMHRLGPVKTSKNTPVNPAPAAVAFAGLLLAGFLGRYSRKFRNLAGLIALLAVGFAVSACGGGGSSTPVAPTNPSKGTYTITLAGQDSATSSINATTTFTLTID